MRSSKARYFFNFYPRPPRGGRRLFRGERVVRDLFLSTPSARRATPVHTCSSAPCWISIHALREEGDFVSSVGHRRHEKFLSTPSARRATVAQPDATEGVEISIHALREEGDLLWRKLDFLRADFYPRPPRGGRPEMPASRRTAVKFLSTPSARRATHLLWFGDTRPQISIHALREEGDL